LVLIVPATCEPCPFVSVCAALLAKNDVEMMVFPTNAEWPGSMPESVIQTFAPAPPRDGTHTRFAETFL